MNENRLVPKHELIGGEETEKLLSYYQTTKEFLPKIHREDPAIKEMEVSIGDVIKITREDHSVGKSTHYRVVIE
ncbi:DNA-directed RNA polymerase subunit RpoH/Rpb5 C-terminal domain-containing protein [Candidatus Altiarchaeota archaeon]